MISRYNENSVSAIGNFNQPINLLILLFSIISLAATILIYQYRGVGRPDKVNMVMVHRLQAAGDVIVHVATGVVSMWAVAVGLSYLLGACFNWGLVGVWVAMVCDEIGRAVVFLLRYKSGAWKSKKLLYD